MWAGWDSTASAGTWDGTGSTFRTYYSVASTSAYDIEMAEERALAKIRLYKKRLRKPRILMLGMNQAKINP